MPTPSFFPVIYGSYALLRPLAAEDEWAVFLIAIKGAAEPWVIKRRRQREGGDFERFKAEVKVLARMTSPQLARVLTATEINGEVGMVMEHAAGKSLAAICERASQRSLLLPPELGGVVAHDVFSALLAFHDFEGANLVHGNLSPRAIMVGYAGEAKVIGYRPGSHERAGAVVQVAKDLTPLAAILSELPFGMFPAELVQVVPRLLESGVAPVEAVAAVQEFLKGSEPSGEARRRLGMWLAEVFPGERERESKESEGLVAEGLKLIAQSMSGLGSPRNLVVGDEIGGYRVLKVLGEGGMARVFEAENLVTGRHVALKVLHPRGRTRDIEERFRREAEAILRIANPHVVGIEQFGASPDGRYLYLAMELLQGASLHHVLAREGPLDLRRALRIASQICQALSATHAVGIIHRDLKPGNVMLVPRKGEAGETDFVKVLDFGLARLDVGEAALTRAGDLIGTLLYMAPEQGQGQPATPSIDVYAVGEMLYEMLTKKLPHQESSDILARKATADPVPITAWRPDLHDGISEMVMKALARDPAARYASMAELGQAIDMAIAGLAGRRAQVGGRWRRAAVACLAGAMLATAGLMLARNKGRGGSPPSLPEEVVRLPVGDRPPSVEEPPGRSAVVKGQPGPPPLAREQAGGPPAVEPPVSLHEDDPGARAPSARGVRSKPKAMDTRAGKEKSGGAEADHLLSAAKTAYDRGNRVEAIKLGLEALSAGGGLRAHRALGNYYRGMERYREALQHYRAALELDPDDPVAREGAKLVEGQLSPASPSLWGP